MNAKKTKSKTGKKMSAEQNKSPDIIDLILDHHRPLKSLIKTMKSETTSYAEKKKAFSAFGPTLVAHAKPEEQSLYVSMKSKTETKIEGLEGDVEHGLADQLCDELKATQEKDLFLAKVKVLAELVEHHIEEEEEKMLPHFKRKTNLETRVALGEKYSDLREQFLNTDTTQSKVRTQPEPASAEVRIN